LRIAQLFHQGGLAGCRGITLVFDLQFRLRCKGCNRRSDFRITLFAKRTRGDSSKPRLELVVVAGE
jgi:hypothetical protein